MSELKVDKISPGSGTTTTIGQSGDTFTIPVGAILANLGTVTGFGGGLVKYIGTSELAAVGTTSTATSYTTTGATITIPAADVVGLSKIIILTDGVGRQDFNGAANITEFRTQRTAPSAVNYEATVSGANITTGLNEILYQRGSLIVDSSLGTGDHTYGVYFRKYAGLANQVNGIYFKQSGWRILAIGI
tara:strand:+ start:353 stop:919 length:567 start_codon:yes stop_codon:yes gene_type:complete